MKCRKEGCRANATPSGYCYFHDPALERRRKISSAKGGKARYHPELKLETLSDIKTLLVSTIAEIKSLKKSTSKARAIGYLVTCYRELIEAVEHEQRITELEKTLQVNEFRR